MKTCRKGLHQFSNELTQCYECKRIGKKAWKIKNSFRVKKSKKEWNTVNANKIKSNKNKWYLKNKDIVKTKVKAYRDANVGRTNALSAKRNAARLMATPKWLTKKQLTSIRLYYEAAKWIESILDEKIHVDHIMPLRGKISSGLHVPWNLQLLTRTENCHKGNKYNP